MSYIHNTEHHRKIALADSLCPKIIHSDLMNNIMDELDLLYENYHELRKQLTKQSYDEARIILHEKIIPLEKQWTIEFRKNNKKYCEYWES